MNEKDRKDVEDRRNDSDRIRRHVKGRKGEERGRKRERKEKEKAKRKGKGEREREKGKRKRKGKRRKAYWDEGQFYARRWKGHQFSFSFLIFFFD